MYTSLMFISKSVLCKNRFAICEHSQDKTSPTVRQSFKSIGLFNKVSHHTHISCLARICTDFNLNSNKGCG